MQRLSLQLTAWFSVAAWAVTIFWLSSRTGPEIEELNVFEIGDKIAHFAAFFVGAALLVLALRLSTQWRQPRVVIAAAFAIALFGAIDEYHQTFTANRSGADVYDWLADALGGCTGAAVMMLVYARFIQTPRAASARD